MGLNACRLTTIEEVRAFMDGAATMDCQRLEREGACERVGSTPRRCGYRGAWPSGQGSGASFPCEGHEPVDAAGGAPDPPLPANRPSAGPAHGRFRVVRRVVFMKEVAMACETHLFHNPKQTDHDHRMEAKISHSRIESAAWRGRGHAAQLEGTPSALPRPATLMAGGLDRIARTLPSGWPDAGKLSTHIMEFTLRGRPNGCKACE